MSIVETEIFVYNTKTN